MSLKSDLRFVINPNYAFIEWLEVLDNDRRSQLVREIGIQAMKICPNGTCKYLSDTFVKLASKCGLSLYKLSDAEIEYYLRIKDAKKSDSVSNTSSGGSSSSTEQNKKTSVKDITVSNCLAARLSDNEE